MNRTRRVTGGPLAVLPSVDQQMSFARHRFIFIDADFLHPLLCAKSRECKKSQAGDKNRDTGEKAK